MINLMKILFSFIFIVSCSNDDPVSVNQDCNYDVNCCLCFEFTKLNNADSQESNNQDCVFDNICLTRGNNGALYNAFYYTSYNEMLNAYENGDNPLIKWSEGTVEQAQNGELIFYNGLTNEAGNFGQLVQLPDRNIVAYLVEHEIYLNFDFLSWSSGQQGGGFSYLRDIPNILQ